MIARVLVLASALCVSLPACGGGGRSKELPAPDAPPMPAPDLTGQKVMLFPVQGSGMVGGGVGTDGVARARPVPASLDAEIAFWLSDRAPGVRWFGPKELDRVIARSPGLGLNLRNLAVEAFRRMRVTQISDPLYGDLRRLGAITDTRYALVPVTAAYVPLAEGEGRIEIAAALIDTSRALVIWYGVAAGSTGPATDEAVVSSAAQRLAEQITPAPAK
jgi:hypothetical protein